MKKIKKKSLTLIEIMVVIALIGIIGSVLGVNMKKSMDKAKVFKSKAHAQKIEDALNIYYAENSDSPDEIAASIKSLIPNFQISYAPDFRQNIANSWPKSIDDIHARNDWGWRPNYDLQMMTTDILSNLKNVI